MNKHHGNGKVPVISELNEKMKRQTENRRKKLHELCNSISLDWIIDIGEFVWAQVHNLSNEN